MPASGVTHDGRFSAGPTAVKISAPLPVDQSHGAAATNAGYVTAPFNLDSTSPTSWFCGSPEYEPSRSRYTTTKAVPAASNEEITK